MTKHNRRKNYWPYYELTKTRDRERMETLIQVIHENPCPCPKGSNRGRPPGHSKEKLDFVCLWMMANNDTYRDAEGDMREMRTPWDNEPVPDHTTICRHMKEIPPDWLDLILAETARRCMEAAGDVIGPLGSDSSGVMATRYETAGSSDSETEQSRRKEYGKHHITSILGLQIILTAFYAPGNVHDSRMLVPMFDKIKRLGFDFSGLIFNAGGTYDMEFIFEYILWRRMFPNIKQRKGSPTATRHPKERRRPNDSIRQSTQRGFSLRVYSGRRRHTGTNCTAGLYSTRIGSGLQKGGQLHGISVFSTGLSTPTNFTYQFRHTVE